jgi:hypothetical protein
MICWKNCRNLVLIFISVSVAGCLGYDVLENRGKRKTDLPPAQKILLIPAHHNLNNQQLKQHQHNTHQN